jgi:hypothetical protein
MLRLGRVGDAGFLGAVIHNVASSSLSSAADCASVSRIILRQCVINSPCRAVLVPSSGRTVDSLKPDETVLASESPVLLRLSLLPVRYGKSDSRSGTSE